MIHAAFLKKVYLFEHLTDEELELVSKCCHEKDVIAGDYIFNEGVPATSMFVVKSGSVEIRKVANFGDEQRIADLAAGSHFGEMAFLDHSLRAASVAARENTQLIEIQYEELDKVLRMAPMIAAKLYKAFAQILCRRIRHTTNELSSLKELKLRHL